MQLREEQDGAWTTTVTLLTGNEALEGKLFAATTLKGKVRRICLQNV